MKMIICTHRVQCSNIYYVIMLKFNILSLDVHFQVSFFFLLESTHINTFLKHSNQSTDLIKQCVLVCDTLCYYIILNCLASM